MNPIKLMKGYTSDGCRLLSKDSRRITSAERKDKTCARAYTVDVMKVATEFGHYETEIKIYKDRCGHMLKRIMSKVGKSQPNKEVERAETIYSHNDVDGTVREIKNIYKQGKNTQTIHEGYNVYTDNEGKLGVGRVKLVMDKQANGARKETQVYEELQTGGQRKYIETTATRLADGTYKDKTLSGNIDYKGLENDPYLYMRSYSAEDFIRSLIPFAKQQQGIPNRKLRVIPTSFISADGASLSGTNIILVDKVGHCKEDLVNTVHHEVRHQYQNEMKSKLGFWRYLFGMKSDKLSDSANKLAKKFWKADILYCPPEISYNKYYNNALEIDARKGGDSAVSLYTDLTEKLASKLPNVDITLFNSKTLNQRTQLSRMGKFFG